MHAGADLEPGGRDDDRVDERALDAVVDGRLVALVDDADRHQHHARAHVEAAREQEVDVGLLELQLAGFLEPFDQRVLQLQLADESDAVAEAVREEQHEAMEVEASVLEFGLVEMEVHVARKSSRAVPADGRAPGPGPRPPRPTPGSRGRGTERENRCDVVKALECSVCYI